jgi:hypothetical protein
MSFEGTEAIHAFLLDHRPVLAPVREEVSGQAEAWRHQPVDTDLWIG